ncbi:MAG: redoxin domain-containing protein [Bacteroidota bacterium]|nr:redoxin domain-containing protein [Bacteroidota bacterium]
MNTKIKVTVLLLLFIIVGFMLYVIITKIEHKKAIEENIKIIPEFAFTKLTDKKIFTNRELKSDRSKLIIYFNTECDHCMCEAEQISQNIEQFSNFQIIMISYEEIDTLQAFAEKYNFTEQNNITVLQDKKFEFDDIFGRSPIPTSFIYNKNKDLIKKFVGEVKIEALLKYLNE